MSSYAKADTTAQWFGDRYVGSLMKPNVVVIHTTETSGWPGYGGGATAPNYTAKPNFDTKKLDLRQHYPDERSSRALVNSAGGVETNTLNAVQIELVGTCDPAHAKRWGSKKAGIDYIYWPDAPEWALQGVADFLLDQHERHGTLLQAPKFRAYPDSYGTNNGVRLTAAEWRNFYGVCGHQHVPENFHGDPGALPIDTILALTKPKEPHVAVHNHVTKARAEIWAGCNQVSRGIRELWLVDKSRRYVWVMAKAVQLGNQAIRAALKVGPKS